MPDPADEGTPALSLSITEKPEGTLSSRLLGTEPYLLVTIQDADEYSASFHLEVGGGAPSRPLDELAAFFDGIAEMLREGTESTDDNEAES